MRKTGKLLAQEVVRLALIKKQKFCFAESCTGGLLAELITSIPNASKVFEYSLVTYSVESKIALLKLPQAIINKYSTTSWQCALHMAKSVIMDPSHIGISITGLAGNKTTYRIKDLPLDKDTNETGKVFFGSYANETGKWYMETFSGSRDSIRLKASIYAMQLLKNLIQQS